MRWTLPEARNLRGGQRARHRAALRAPADGHGARGGSASPSASSSPPVFYSPFFWCFARGIGIWGVNTTVVWGFAIADYVWWIGIGNAGTLISAMLLLMRQQWRASTNRFAEAMTLFAASIAGLFPIIHLGPADVFLLAHALSEHDGVVAAVAQRLDLGFLGDPELPALLDPVLVCRPYPRSRHDAGSRPQQIPRDGVWRPGAWLARLGARIGGPTRRLHLTLACLGVPLVVSLHSVVGMDFAASLMPGWQETIFPPYFVVGAMYSGFAMVVCLAALVRWGFRMQALITLAHFDVMAKIMLAAAVIMGLSYANEWFNAWYGGEHADRSLIAFEFAGAYAPMFWALLLCNVVIPQAFWLAAVRRNVIAVFAIAVLINIGMWLERILIIWNTLSHDYAVSMWRLFLPTAWDWITTIGSLGLFALMYLIFVRLLPVVSMHEVRKLIDEESS